RILGRAHARGEGLDVGARGDRREPRRRLDGLVEDLDVGLLREEPGEGLDPAKAPIEALVAEGDDLPALAPAPGRFATFPAQGGPRRPVAIEELGHAVGGLPRVDAVRACERRAYTPAHAAVPRARQLPLRVRAGALERSAPHAHDDRDGD